MDFAVLVTRKVEFDAGHRLVGHESKCAHLHGHRYVLEITVESNVLDSVGRVIDFSFLKNLLGGWIDDNWDHNIILNSQDSLLAYRHCRDVFTREPYVLQNINPTAENMVRYLWNVFTKLIWTDSFIMSLSTGKESPIKLHTLRLWETPNCYAELSVLNEPDLLR